MTDNEIIKALKCCKNEGIETCRYCPLFQTLEFDDVDDFDCGEYLYERAIDLINRQKAEIERYKEIKTSINEFWDILLKLKIAKRKEKPTLEELAEAIEVIETEAIKEFAERLKSKFTHSGKSTKHGEFTWDDVTSYEIDNLVNEMCGE